MKNTLLKKIGIFLGIILLAGLITYAANSFTISAYLAPQQNSLRDSFLIQKYQAYQLYIDETVSGTTVIYSRIQSGSGAVFIQKGMFNTARSLNPKAPRYLRASIYFWPAF